MPITIYNNASDKKVIGKTLTQVSVESYILLDDCSIINPQLTMKYASGVLTANYAYIAEFNRYYFIDNVTVLKASRLKLDLSIDVLETYKTQIKALTCIVKRNANVFNKYLDDPYFQSSAKKQIQTKSIASGQFYPNSLSDATPCFVLTIAKG